MAFFHAEELNKNVPLIPSQPSSLPLQDDQDESMELECQNHGAARDSQDVSALLDDTILGLEEVGDLLQESLKEIEKERVNTDVVPQSKARPISRVLQENNAFLCSTDRDNRQGNILEEESTIKVISKTFGVVEKGKIRKTSAPILSNHRFPISKDNRSLVSPSTKSAYNKINIVQEVTSSSPIVQKTVFSHSFVPPTPPTRTASSRQPSPALSPGIDRKLISIQEASRPLPPTAAAALLHEIRNSVTSPTPLMISPDPVISQNHQKCFVQPCKRDSSPHLVEQNNYGCRKLSARQCLSKTSLKIVQDCKHPQSTSPTPTGSPTVSPQPQQGNIQHPLSNLKLPCKDFTGSKFGVDRKHSSPPILLTHMSSSIVPNGNYTNGIDDAYCRSSALDKMSDYEDIWNDTLPTPRNSLPRPERSMTPAQSEQHFKAYLATKLFSSPSNTSSINNISRNSCDPEKSPSITSFGFSTNTNNSKSSSTSTSSSQSSMTVTHSSPGQSIRKCSYGSYDDRKSQAPLYNARRSVSVSSEVPLIMKCAKVVPSKTHLDQTQRKFSGSDTKSAVTYNGDLMPLNSQSETTTSNFYNNHQTISTIESSISSFVASNAEDADQTESSLISNNNAEDPVYSDPLDALENEKDTRIYNSLDLKDHAKYDENIYEEALNTETQQNQKILLPLIESDHESSDSASSITCSSSLSSNTKRQSSPKRNKKLSHTRRKSSLDTSLTNLSQFEKLFMDDNSNLLMHDKNDSKSNSCNDDSINQKTFHRSHSLSMEGLHKEKTESTVGTPLCNVRKTSVSSYEENKSKKIRKTSVSSISIKRREKNGNTSNNNNRTSNRLSAVIGKYIRPASVVANQVEAIKTTTWQLDSSSWEFLGQQENTKDTKAKAPIDSNVCIHVNPLQCDDIAEERKCDVLQNQSFIVSNTASDTSSKSTKSSKHFDVTNRSGSSSPYDNLFLEPSNENIDSKANGKYNVEKVLIENLRNENQYSPAFNKYGPIAETERSHFETLDNDGYTSDDSLYQSEENQSSCSIGSMPLGPQTGLIKNKISSNDESRKKVKKKLRQKETKHDNENQPRIEMAVRRSTASVMGSCVSPPSKPLPIYNNICPIHDQSDFIGNIRVHINN